MTADKTYTVTFVGDYFTLISTPVEASGGDEAMDIAGAMIKDHYGWNVLDTSNEIEAAEMK